MFVVETKHFLERWECRVGESYSTNVRDIIKQSIDMGNTRVHWREDRGILVGIMYGGKRLYIVGLPTAKSFLLKTVVTIDMILQMGWKPMKLRIPNGFKRHMCMSCGKKCVPMTVGDNWYNPKKGVRENVVVCQECAKAFGQQALMRASANTDQYLEEVRWSSLSTTAESASPSN